MIEIGIQQLNAMAILVDGWLLEKNKENELTDFLNVHCETQFVFVDEFCKGYFITS